MRNLIRAMFVAAVGVAASGCVGAADDAASTSQALLVDCNALLATGPHVPVTSVLNATIGGGALTAGGAVQLMDVMSGDPTHFDPRYTCIGVFDAGMTSDPATGGVRQIGAIASPGTWYGPRHLSVNVDPASLTTVAGGKQYWLRMVSQVTGGWEVAEGVIMVN